MVADNTCPTCGRPLDSHNQHFRFTLPDPVLDTPARESAPGTWMSHGDPNSSVMMQVPSVGPFVRVLLPVSLTGGFTVTFGVWLLVHPDDLARAYRIWWEPQYADLVLDGWLANALPGLGTAGCPRSRPGARSGADALLRGEPRPAAQRSLVSTVAARGCPRRSQSPVGPQTPRGDPAMRLPPSANRRVVRGLSDVSVTHRTSSSPAGDLVAARQLEGKL